MMKYHVNWIMAMSTSRYKNANWLTLFLTNPLAILLHLLFWQWSWGPPSDSQQTISIHDVHLMKRVHRCYRLLLFQINFETWIPLSECSYTAGATKLSKNQASWRQERFILLNRGMKEHKKRAPTILVVCRSIKSWLELLWFSNHLEKVSLV